MEHSIFGETGSQPEEDPWKLPSPKLGLLAIEVEQPWTTHLSDDENNSSNENGNHINGYGQLSNIFKDAPDPFGDDNTMSRSQVIEDAIVGDNALTSRIDTTTVNYDEDAALNDNIWDIELTNLYDPLSFRNSTDKSFIRVKEISEKEGLVFKHINYMIIHNIKFVGDTTNSSKTDKEDVKIIRRYSDFFWLYEVLLKKYPFRSIPELPPKKFNGNSTSNDSLFLQNRRRGLQRFLNQLIKHPILNKESLVTMFLKVPNDFNNWKKIAKIDLTDEFDGKKLALSSKYKLKYQSIPKEEDEDTVVEPTVMEFGNEQIYKNIELIWDENDGKQTSFASNIEILHRNLSRIIDLWSKLTILIERFEKRKIAMSLDEQRFQLIMKNFLDNDSKIFQMDKLVDINQHSQLYNFEKEETQNLGIVNTLLSKVPKFFESQRVHQHEELAILNSTHLENFKKFQDYLNAFNDMLDRLIVYKANTERSNQIIIGKLIKSNEKLTSWLKKPDIKGSDFDKLNNFMNLQILELNNNISKIFLVKNCVKFEFKLFNKLKYLLSEIFHDWFADKVKYGELYGDLLEKCFAELQELPLR